MLRVTQENVCVRLVWGGGVGGVVRGIGGREGGSNEGMFVVHLQMEFDFSIFFFLFYK